MKYNNAAELLKAVKARKAADALVLAMNAKTEENKKAEEEKEVFENKVEKEENEESKKTENSKKQPASNKTNKKIKRESTKEYLVEEKEQPEFIIEEDKNE